MGHLGVARANTAVRVSSETFLLLLLQDFSVLAQHTIAFCKLQRHALQNRTAECPAAQEIRLLHQTASLA
jgi:hypothetical protein